MKKFVLSIIFLYQISVATILKHLFGVQDLCRYSPSCSEYTKQQIIKHGIITGGYRGFIQLLTCHPFTKIKDQRLNLKNADKKAKSFYL